MKKLTVLTLSLSLSLSLLKADYWTQKASFGGNLRSFPFSFSIDNKGYMGGGINYDLGNVFFLDFWEYDPATDAWTQKADFAGNGSHGGIGFSILNKGYAGTGYNSSFVFSEEMFEYDPALNTWTQIADFGGGPRLGAASFTIGNKGYAGTGYSQSTPCNDLWEYDPMTNVWTQKNNLASSRVDAISFSINNKGYWGCGYNQPDFLIDFWEYDPATDSWTQKADFGGIARSDAASFCIGNKGYVGVGEGAVIGSDLNDFWQYDPSTNQWTQKASFPGIARDEPVYFSIGNTGYIGLGYHYGIAYYNDFYEYSPDSTTGISDPPEADSDFTISPNPASEFLVISSEFREENQIKISITDVTGKSVFENKLTCKTLHFKLQNLNFPDGIYFVEVSDSKQKVIKKFVKE